MRSHGQAPFVALGAVLLVAAVAFAVPASRAWIDDEMLAPLRAQAEGRPGTEYSVPSLAAWALVGGALAWAAYELVLVRMRIALDRRFFLALAPWLLFGPLLHALLVARALPSGPVAILAAQPLVYLTTAVLAVAALALGHATRRPLGAPLAAGLVALAPLLALAIARASVASAGRALVLVALAAAGALALALAYARLRPREDRLVAGAVIGAHALDGATTWMVLRDPFGLGFEGFTEQNPVSRALVEASNGWPYFAAKLALPVVLLLAVRAEEGEEGLHAFLLLAVFVLGWGPGSSNLLQVILA